MEVFKQRREHLIKKLGNHSMAIIPSAKEQYKNHYHAFRFRQDGHFYYLTGFEETNSTLLLLGNPAGPRSVLFVEEKDFAKERWFGERLGVDAASDSLKVDLVLDTKDFDQVVGTYLTGHEAIYYDFQRTPLLGEKISKLLSDHRPRKGGSLFPNQICDLHPYIGVMRMVKDSLCISNMEKAQEISAHAHKLAMAKAKDGMYEYELQAIMDYAFKNAGANGEAYGSIVAGGARGNFLHYDRNNKQLFDGETVLIDAGCEYNYYASDITRTFPISGKFSPEQKEVYELVLKAQKAAIESIRPGVTWPMLSKIALEILVEGLIKLKILSGDIAENIEKKTFFNYYPHSLGHWLGLDTHDIGPTKKDDGSDVEFVPGMVLTIEPGLYFPIDDEKVPQKFRGIAVRIEDDILVTENGFKNLTMVPKEVADVEAACNVDWKSLI